jgi:hypothetical protein
LYTGKIAMARLKLTWWIPTDSWGFPAEAVPRTAARAKRENFMVNKKVRMFFGFCRCPNWKNCEYVVATQNY